MLLPLLCLNHGHRPQALHAQSPAACTDCISLFPVQQLQMSLPRFRGSCRWRVTQRGLFATRLRNEISAVCRWRCGASCSCLNDRINEYCGIWLIYTFNSWRTQCSCDRSPTAVLYCRCNWSPWRRIKDVVCVSWLVLGWLYVGEFNRYPVEVKPELNNGKCTWKTLRAPQYIASEHVEAKVAAAVRARAEN